MTIKEQDQELVAWMTIFIQLGHTQETQEGLSWSTCSEMPFVPKPELRQGTIPLPHATPPQ